MKRLLIVSMLMLIGVSLVFVLGCDEEKSTGPGGNKTEGDPNDPVYTAVSDGMEAPGEFNGMLLSFTMEFSDAILDSDVVLVPQGEKTFFEKALGIEAESLSLSYHDASQYWYFFFTADELDTLSNGVIDTLVLTVTDSIQFLHDTLPVQFPDSALLTGIKCGASLEATSSFHGTISVTQNASIEGDLPAQGDIMIVGTGTMNMNGRNNEDTVSYCTIVLAMNVVFDSLQANLTDLENDGCPYAGSWSFSGSINLNCFGDTLFSYNDTWTVHETFNGNITTTTFENSTTKWTIVDTCEAGGDAPVWEWDDRKDR